MSEPREYVEDPLLWENLSLRQVDQLICRWVQGWYVFESDNEMHKAMWETGIPYPYAIWNDQYDCYNSFYEEGMDAKPYLPSRNANHALWLYHSLPLFTNAAFFLNKKGNGCHAKLRTVEKRSFHGNAKTLPLAICQAALTAYGIVTGAGEVYIP